MTATFVESPVALTIILVLVAVYGVLLPAAIAYGVIKHLRDERAARRAALRELADAVADGRPADEACHAPEGRLIPLYKAPSFGRRDNHPRGAA